MRLNPGLPVAFSLVFAVGSLLAQQACKILQERPVGSTQQGGYAFDYYSGMGANCRVFKLRNHPGRLKTPVLWKSPNEIFFDTVLAACPDSGTACDWIVVSRDAWKPYESKTELTYGVNKDEYREAPESFLDAQRQASAGTEWAPLVTTIEGPISDGEGRPIVVGLRVASYAARAERGYVLKQVLSALPKSVALEMGAMGKESSGSGITVVWESAESAAMLRQWERREDKRLAVATAGAMTYEITAPEMEVSEKTVALIQYGKRIFTTTAPAYRAKGE